MMKKLLASGSALRPWHLPPKATRSLNKIKIGGTGGWDYVAVDPDAHASTHRTATLVEVVDLKQAK